MNTKRLIAASCFALAGSAFSASAAVIGFDDATGGGPNSSYWEEGFYFEPAGSTGDIKCFDGKCLKEVTQTVGTTMTYDVEPDGEPDDTYSLDFFYFVAIGNTTTENNSYTVQGLDASGEELYKAEFTIGQDFDGYDFDLGAGSEAYVSFAKDIGSDPDNPAEINYNVGYWVDLVGWDDITYTRWFINTADGPTDGQWRLDCVGVNEPNVSGAQSGCVAPDVIPLPAAGWLLLGGLASLVAIRKRYTV